MNRHEEKCGYLEPGEFEKLQKEKEKNKKMTDIGYSEIMDRITEKEVVPPINLNALELSTWLNGYTKCQLDILGIIEELKNGRNQFA